MRCQAWASHLMLAHSSQQPPSPATSHQVDDQVVHAECKCSPRGAFKMCRKVLWTRRLSHHLDQGVHGNNGMQNEEMHCSIAPNTECKCSPRGASNKMCRKVLWTRRLRLPRTMH